MCYLVEGFGWFSFYLEPPKAPHFLRSSVVQKGRPYTLFRPRISDTTNNTRKTKNKIFAIPTAVPAMPVKPSNAAIKATMRNVMDQPNILNLSFLTFLNLPRLP
jgi:hypothetical protein